MRNVFIKILALLARAIIRRHKPKIVGITGSVGKTSTKDAVFAVLAKKFRVRASQESYNNEFGLPLTIIGAKAGGKSPFQWLWVFAKALWELILDASYPEILVLEMGADKPGDMSYLVSIARPDVAVVTMVASSHLAAFKTIEATAKEKRVLVEALSRTGHAVLNYDDSRVMGMKEKIAAHVHTFGCAEGADARAIERSLVFEKETNRVSGLRFKLVYKGSVTPVYLPHIITKHHVYAVLAAVCVGKIFHINPVESTASLGTLRSAPRRMDVLIGKRDTHVIDSTFNASDVSTIAALDTLAEVGVAGRRVAVLGDMLELGKFTHDAHRVVGKKVAQTADVLVTAGVLAKEIAMAAQRAGMPKDRIFSFSSATEAADHVKKSVAPGDWILVKGSKATHMEVVVDAIVL